MLEQGGNWMLSLLFWSGLKLLFSHGSSRWFFSTQRSLVHCRRSHWLSRRTGLAWGRWDRKVRDCHLEVLLGRACSTQTTLLSLSIVGVWLLGTGHFGSRGYPSGLSSGLDTIFAAFWLGRRASFGDNQFRLRSWRLLDQAALVTLLWVNVDCRWWLWFNYESRFDLLRALGRHHVLFKACLKDRVLPACMNLILKIEVGDEAFVDILSLGQTWRAIILLSHVTFIDDVLVSPVAAITESLRRIGCVW